MKIALYERVSTDEQKKFGISVMAQKSALENYAKSHNYDYEHFTDEGFSGGKLERPALQRLLKEVENNKIKMIAFTKLDRWFRSVALYHKIQEVLDQHNCTWVCIDEDYETITSSGKFKVNIMLSVAEAERLKASERVKAVFDYKMSQGYTCSGSYPLGFGLEDTPHGKRVVCTNPELIKDFVDKVDEFNSIIKARRFIMNKYDVKLSYSSFGKLLHSPYIYGEFHGQQIFEPIVPKQRVNRVIENLEGVRSQKTYEFVFKSLCVCPICGRKMAAKVQKYQTKKGTKIIKLYRCSWAYKGECTYKRVINEKKLETYVLAHIKEDLKNYTFSLKERSNAPKIDKNKIQAKMKRLNDMYLEDRCSKEYFDEHYKELKKQLEYMPPKVDELEKVLNLDIEEVYSTMTIQQRNMFWRGLIKSIKRIDDNFYIDFV